MDALLVEFLHRIEALQTEVRLHLESHNTVHSHEEYALTGHEHAAPPEPEPEPEPEKDLPPPEPEAPKVEDETPEKAPERHHPLHGRIGGSK
jgi:outer membrane biosynthesis protein TonB